MITLTQDERNKFSAWLKQQIESDQSILGQMEKMNLSGPLINHNRQKITAYFVVAGVLDSIEEQTIETPNELDNVQVHSVDCCCDMCMDES